MSNDNIIKVFKDELINAIKKETEKEIQERVKEFENKLRELASAKIVSFVDKLKIIATKDLSEIEPKITIQVHL